MKYKEIEELVVCECGNNTWYVDSRGITCEKCGIQKGDVAISHKSDQSEIIRAMGIPPTLPNALDLAKAQLDRLKRKEQMVDKIRDLIELE